MAGAPASFSRHVDGVGVSELMWREPSTHACGGGGKETTGV